MPDQDDLVNAIKRRLTQQLEHYRQIAELSSEEKEALVKNDDMLLLKVLSRKQKIVDKLEIVRRELAKFYENWPAIRGSVDAATKSELTALTDETEKVLKSIIDTEQENMTNLRGKKDDVSKKISGFKYSSNAARSYMGVASARSVIDTKIT